VSRSAWRFRGWLLQLGAAHLPHGACVAKQHLGGSFDHRVLRASRTRQQEIDDAVCPARRVRTCRLGKRAISAVSGAVLTHDALRKAVSKS